MARCTVPLWNISQGPVNDSHSRLLERVQSTREEIATNYSGGNTPKFVEDVYNGYWQEFGAILVRLLAFVITFLDLFILTYFLEAVAVA